MTEQFANNAATTLAAAITTTDATSIQVASAAAFPSSAQYRIIIDSEIMLVTGGAGTTTWTVTRGAEGTTAATHAPGAPVTHILTAGSLAQAISDGAPTASALLASIETVDGIGSGLDSDLLDGQHATAFQTALGYTPVNRAGDTMTGALYGGLYADTEANILASSPADSSLAYATDLKQLMLRTGGAWYLSPIPVIVEGASPDMGYVQNSNRMGITLAYITDKTLANCTLGGNANVSDGQVRYTTSGMQVYYNGQWNTVVAGFVLREDAGYGYAFEHQPIGFTQWIEIMSGNSLGYRDLAGNPLIQGYTASMGCYAYPPYVGGRSI